MNSIKANTLNVFLVGGAVRDKLLGIDNYDRDWVVVGSTVEEMLQLGYKQVGADFPVFIHPESGEEYALARSERKKGAGYKGFIVDFKPQTTLEEDLLRRDFTINAIAEDESGKLIDPHNGESDIKEGIIRHVSPAFSEDPLRVLRGARFLAKFQHRGFSIHAETIEAMRAVSSEEELNALPAERIWQECERACACASPQAFIEALRQCGALGVLFPEVEALFGVPQPKKYHPEGCAGTHTLLVMERTAVLSQNDPVAVFAALCHDLGKATTPSELWPGHAGHEQRSARITADLCHRLRVPNRFRHIAEKIARLHMKAHQINRMRANTLLRLLTDLDAFRKPVNLDYFIIVCEADIQGRGDPTLEFGGKELLRAAYGAAKSVNEAEIASVALDAGKPIADAIREARTAAIKTAVAQVMLLDKN